MELFKVTMARMTICLVFLWASPACSKSDSGTRPPKPLEHAYIGFALEVEDHRVCEKISPHALSKAPFNSPGTQVYFTRSACHLYLAHRTLNPFFCKQVVEAEGGALSDGSHFSRSNCEELVNSGQALRASIGFDRELIMRALGYTENDLGKGDWIDLYYRLRKEEGGALQKKILELPDLSKD